MPYCFEFTFTFILVNKKIKKKSGEGEVREEREEMIPPHTSWTGFDALFSSMRPQSGRAYRVRIVFFPGQDPGHTPLEMGVGLMENPTLKLQALV